MPNPKKIPKYRLGDFLVDFLYVWLKNHRILRHILLIYYKY
ncbi:hypothetical protein EJK48_0418 [Moraxella catarrhalis]|nr:hypothetical protein EJK48_0418 [Moraxella catarrhalis]EKF83932.1 hypothetical protein MCRH_0445 [Moraxella catarrhalis RH4]RUO14480.1 hypothetical protein EJK49_1621 [Moraxella catarrhalis]